MARITDFIEDTILKAIRGMLLRNSHYVSSRKAGIRDKTYKRFRAIKQRCDASGATVGIDGPEKRTTRRTSLPDLLME
jgi:hypothetical protein